MAANVLGRAYIEVHADTKPFAREMLAETEAITKLTEKKARTSGRKVGKELGEGIREEAEKSAPKVAGVFSRIFTRAFSRFRGGGNGRSFFGSFTSRFFSRAAKAGVEVGEEIGKNAAKGFAAGFQNGMGVVMDGISNVVRSIGSSVGNVGSAGPFALILGVGIIALIPALIGAIISLISVLGPLLYLLLLIPGAIAGLVAAIAPVILAFQGFAGAVAAVMSGDPKQIAEAFKNLAPAARQVAREVAPLIEMFKSLGKIAQQAFFQQLIGAFKGLAPLIGPIFRRGFTQVAIAAGEFARHLIMLASNPQVQKFFASSFDFAAKLFEILGPPMLNFITALAALSTASFPALEKLFGMLGGVLNRFAEWIQRSIANGDFDDFMDKMIQALKDVSDLVGSGKDLIVAMLGGPEQRAEARDFFKQLIGVIDGLTTFFRSEDGKMAISGMIMAAKVFVTALYVVLLVAFEIVAAFQLIYETIVKIIELIPGVHVGNSNSLAPKGGATAGNVASGSISHAIGHARGGVFGQEHLAWIAEDNKKEVILPMTDPSRARDIANRAGVSSMLDTETVVNVYIGDEQIMARVDKRVGGAFKQFGRQMKFGPRTVGVGA